MIYILEDPLSKTILLSNIFTISINTKLAIGVASFVLLLIFSALISTAETAFISSSYIKIDEIIKNKNSKRAMLVKKMLENPNKFLSTIQVINTMIAFINGAITSSIFTKYIFATYFNTTPLLWQSILITIGLTITTAYFQVVIGELVPKRIGMKWPERVIIRLIYFVMIFYYLFFPFVIILTSSTTLISRLFGVKKGDEIKPVTEEEIKAMVNARSKVGKDESYESDVINNVFEFNDTTVDEIMTHRTEVSAIDIKSSTEEIYKIIKDLSYTRYPVYDETIDNIVGILHIKDVLQYLINGTKTMNIKKIIRPPHFVFEGKKINDLFQEMKKNRIHLSVVVDEYGGTAGIVTLEDLIEEVLGDIDDEYDDAEKDIQEVGNNIYKINGHISLEELQDFLKIEFPTDEFDTLSGFMIYKFNKIPKDDDLITFIYNGYQFRSLSIKEMVVSKALVKKIIVKEN